MELTWSALIGWIASGLVGGGTVAAIGYRALKDRLEEDFATVFHLKSDAERMRDRLEAMTNMLSATSARVDEGRDQIVQLQQSERYRGDSVGQLLERVEQRLESHGRRLDKHEQILTRTVTILDRLERRMERDQR